MNLVWGFFFYILIGFLLLFIFWFYWELIGFLDNLFIFIFVVLIIGLVMISVYDFYNIFG